LTTIGKLVMPILSMEITSPKIKTADRVFHLLSQQILEGSYLPGDRLPPERKLALDLGVSRPTLRAALARLESRGQLYRKHGGGTFIAEPAELPLAKFLLEEFQDDAAFRADLLEFRMALESTAARHAASRATSDCRRLIKMRYAAWETAFQASDITTMEETEADLAFHLSVADASHNLVLPHFMRLSFSLLKQHIYENLREYDSAHRDRNLLVTEHRQIMETVLDGDPDGAEMAVRQHLGRVQATMEEGALVKMRTDRAHRRVARSGKNPLPYA